MQPFRELAIQYSPIILHALLVISFNWLDQVKSSEMLHHDICKKTPFLVVGHRELEWGLELSFSGVLR